MQPGPGNGGMAGHVSMPLSPPYPQMMPQWSGVPDGMVMPMMAPPPDVNMVPICRYFGRGMCKYGPKCRFRHVLNGPPAMAGMPMPEPVIRPRIPLSCRFFAAGSCREGDNCRFSHEAAPAQERPVCRYYLAGNCKYMDKCIDRHPEGAQIPTDEQRTLCGGCMMNVAEEGKTFGLLLGCDHLFCLDCTKKWKNIKHDDKDLIKQCAICRSPTMVVVPSSTFKFGEAKWQYIEEYLARLAAIPCKYFDESGDCPFGKICFYAHIDKTTGESLDKSHQHEPRFERIRSVQSASDLISQLPSLLQLLDDDMTLFNFLSVSDGEIEQDVVADMIDQFGSLGLE